MGWLDKFFGRGKAETSHAGNSAPALPVASNEAGDAYSPQDEFRDYIRRDYWAGFRGDDEIVDNAKDIMSDEMDLAELDRIAPALLAEVKAAHAEEQKSWPDKTDCDRLDEAFAALEASGIVARQNFTCCGTCGATEIWDEMAEVRDRGGAVRGYAFYHMQDTESAVEGGGLYLGYGATEEGEEPALTIARNIVTGLEAHGLQTHWDGTWGQRIGVSLDWKKRR